MSSDLITLETSNRRTGGVWDYISPSRLNCWIACPLKFKFRYVDGVRTPATPALFLGKRVHAALEHFYRHRMLGITLEPGDITARIDRTWEEAVADDEMAFESLDKETGLREKAADLVAAYLAQVPSDEPRPVGVEVTMEAPLVDPFTGEDLGIPLLGIVDLVLDDVEGPLIVDFKTASRSGPPFEVTHEIQLTSYSYLYRRMAGRQECGLEIRSLIKTKSPKVEYHRYPSRATPDLCRFLSVIREYLDTLNCGRFNYRPGWGCGMCDFRDTACRQWQG